jgi:hypothetical protein
MASNLATALSNKVTLPDTSSAGPALASALGRVFIGWRGTDVQGHLNVMSSMDGSTFSNKVTLADTSLDGPALAGSVVSTPGLALAWTGSDSLQYRLSAEQAGELIRAAEQEMEHSQMFGALAFAFGQKRGIETG